MKAQGCKLVMWVGGWVVILLLLDTTELGSSFLGSNVALSLELSNVGLAIDTTFKHVVNIGNGTSAYL